MKRSTSFLLAAVIFVILVFGLLWASKSLISPRWTYQTEEGPVFGTGYHITYRAPRSLKTKIEEALHQVDASLSMFNKESTLSRINRGESMQTDSLLREVYRLAYSVSEQTDGAFDITVAPLVNAWGFGFKDSIHITQENIAHLLQSVGYGKIHLQADTIRKEHPETQIDLSAIAKGYGCDRVATALETAGVSDYLIEIGGEICAKGHNAKGRAWTIGVTRPQEDPLQDATDLEGVITLHDVSMATSGNYRNFYYRGTRKYAHTIDPHTGYPVEHSLLSATVLAPTCALADAYATAFMVMGVEKAREVLQRHPELEALLIYQDSLGHETSYLTETLRTHYRALPTP